MRAPAWRRCDVRARVRARPPQDRNGVSKYRLIRQSSRASMHSRLPLGSDALPLVLEPPVRGRRPPVYGRLLLWPDRPPPDTDLVVPVKEDRRDSYLCLPRDRATGPAHHDLRRRDHEARLLDRGPPPFLTARPRFRRAAQTRGDGPGLTAAARE